MLVSDVRLATARPLLALSAPFRRLTPHKMLNYLAASVVAGAVASVVLCPAEEVRIKQVSEPGYCDGGAIATLLKISQDFPECGYRLFPFQISYYLPLLGSTLHR